MKSTDIFNREIRQGKKAPAILQIGRFLFCIFSSPCSYVSFNLLDVPDPCCSQLAVVGEVPHDTLEDDAGKHARGCAIVVAIQRLVEQSLLQHAEEVVQRLHVPS